MIQTDVIDIFNQSKNGIKKFYWTVSNKANYGFERLKRKKQEI